VRSAPNEANPWETGTFVAHASFLQSHWQYLGLIYPPPSHQHDASAHQDGVTDKTQAGKIQMFTNTTFALACVFATASGALAANPADA
jgi:hypothetical protein